MVFPQLPSYSSGPAQESLPPAPQGLDSISLGQLKSMQSYYDFRYDDEDTVLNEIEEFYSYVEMPQVAENLTAWKEGYFPRWLDSTFAQRKAHVEVLLEGLEHRDAEFRFTSARRLLYVLQGTFAETTSSEHQLHWIFENCKVVRAANGVSNIVEAMKIACSKHDLLCSLSDADAAHFNITAAEKANFMEEVTTELSVYLGMLYHMVEVFKGHDDFADELMSLDPPLPVYLFNVVAGLKDKSAKGYPVKKLLLVLWKSILTCCGGVREIARVKKLSRELAGLSSVPDEAIPIKASPLDIELFRQEISVKYPTFAAPPLPTEPEAIRAPIPTSKLAQAYSPIPVRHHYDHDDTDGHHHAGLPQGSHPHPFHPGQQPGTGFRAMPQPATPAPSPPPSPKPKKQQFQTDQTRPFLFPFSRSALRQRNPRLVPFAIDEADKLYNKHMYVSLSLWQMWRTREECMSTESGLDRMPGSEKVDELKANPNANDEDVTEDKLPDMALIDAKIAEAEAEMARAETAGDKRKAKERREDLLRLKRVEQIYSSVLPVLSGWVLVLLKLLLATVSAGAGNAPQSATSANFPPGVSSPMEQPAPVPPSLEETDVTRHREITSKAVSAILLLTLKWFKVSHVMKFHHLGQILLDTNCLLLILKMFGLQEVSTTVVSKADAPEENFFRYCQRHFAQGDTGSSPADEMLNAPRQTSVIRTTVLPNGEKHEEDVDLLTDFSWRNFFSTINFAKIMQKLSKHRSHRIRMLVQYKSSAVLKRILKVQHPMLQLHVLKLIKSQVPFCGRKWRQSNMQVITAIYLNCRPDLRDEWLIGPEGDDASDAQTQEHALRHLVKFYNTRRYGAAAAAHHGGHRRSGSVSQHIEGLHPGPELSGIMRPIGTPNSVDADVFPPLRAQAPDPSIFLPYVTEDIAFEEEYEEYLSDLGWADVPSDTSGPSHPSSSAWSRLPELVSDISDGISDSESIVSIGELEDEGRLNVVSGDRDSVPDENSNSWEHMSPKTMAALTKSPAGGRRSSSGGGLRPVLPFELDDNSAVDEEEDEDLPGPMPRESSGPFHSGAGVDEVEYAYGGMETSPPANSANASGPSATNASGGSGSHSPGQPSAFASAFGGEAEVAPKLKRKRNRMTFRPRTGVAYPVIKESSSATVNSPVNDGTLNTTLWFSIHRGSPSECSYEQASEYPQRRLAPQPASPNANEPGLSERLGQLEAVVSGIIGDLDPTSLAGVEALLHIVQNSDHPAKHQLVAGSRLQPAPTMQAQIPTPSASNPAAPQPILMPVQPGWAYLPAPPTPESLAAQFPSHSIRTFLLTHFFDRSSIHWIYPIVHRPVFDGCYMAFSSGQPQSMDFMALLAIICASSLQFLPESPEDANTFAEYAYGRHVLQRRLFDMARMLLIAPQFVPYPSIERIQALVLFANEGNLVEAYNSLGFAIRMAQAFAMHRDALTVWRMRPFEAEQRRRFWWILYCLDRTQGALLRRPYIILDQHCDVSPPMNLDQSHLLDTPNLVGLPLSTPTDYLFQLEQVKWAQLVGKMWDRCFGIKLPTYRMVIDIENEIRQFESEIAPALNATLPQSADSPPYLIFQRQWLTLQVSHLRTLITRPFLFALPQTDALPETHKVFLTTFSRHARTVCIYYCKQLLSLSHLMQKQSQKSHLRWTSMALRVFDAAMTLAVAVVMDASDHSKGLEVWIILAREILRALAFQNTMANNAYSGVDAICKRVQSIIGQRYPMPSLADSDAHAAQMASTPPPSLSDLLGTELAGNSVWSSIEATVFAGNLPGLEAMCGPMLAHAMDDFLSSCLAALRK
ncbi:Factor arrest protein 11 [Steccherinum ochraceum]|uniref:Factor arrest protein 11 n=1 Tax=Steccherinum ochraceum TaxID=92696 RepID=A0A4R0RSK1_9APHY|nr:Factor arrest protein 11 [Steccherinum ochraceum]